MIQALFLEALGASLKKEKVTWEQMLSIEEWMSLFQLAEIHHVLPMIYDAVYCCPAAKKTDAAYFAAEKRRVLQQVMRQTIKTNAFLALYQHLKQSGVEPILFKGLICRELYPNPDYRISSDEDLLISPEDFDACHQAMLDYGMEVKDPGTNLQSSYEIPYRKSDSPIYIELHKQLFPANSEAYGDWNEFFAHVHEKRIRLNLQGTVVAAMDHTTHFFYLICHAFKHFLHSGIGIRQVCDLALYANAYGSEMDWQVIADGCAAIRAERFAAAMMRIAQKYLTFSPEKACCPEQLRSIQVCESALLEDILCGGVYGGSSMSRRHSSNMTLDAVASQKKGSKEGNTVLTSLFPPVKKMEGRYPYLKKYPVLLPVAWSSRILEYGRETANSHGNGAVEAVKIGKNRIELLKEYGVID